MLVLTRKKEERICIGQNVTLTIVQVRNGSVKIGIEAPAEVRILRGELVESAGEEANADEECTASSDPPSDVVEPEYRAPRQRTAPIERFHQGVGPSLAACG